jgi:hypothetical protein
MIDRIVNGSLFVVMKSDAKTRDFDERLRRKNSIHWSRAQGENGL